MVNYSILEQSLIGQNPKETARKGIPRTNNEVLYHSFTDKRTFETGLTAAIQELFKVKPEAPKLLIISAHGIPRTGTLIDAGHFQLIDFWEFRNHFLVLPQNLVVYLSCCFGAYPSADAFQSGQGTHPIVIGPLVDITFQHANDFQNQLIAVLKRDATSTARIIDLANKFNHESRYRTQYQRRYVIGVLDQSKNRHPIEAAGSQLAAPVEQRHSFEIIGFSPPNFDSPYHCILRDVSGRKYLALTGAVIGLSKELVSLVGKTISAKFQIVQVREDDYISIELKQPRLMK